MLVGERMSHPVIHIQPDLPVPDALDLMRRDHIRQLPVIEHGKLVGIVTERRLESVSPSKATTLNVWELSYMLDKTPVREIMEQNIMELNLP